MSAGSNHVTPKHLNPPKGVLKGRYALDIEGDFVVFSIGALFNKWTQWRDFMAVGMAMGPMQAELAAHPVGIPGLPQLHWEPHGLHTVLEKLGPPDEICKVRAGEYEALYVNCPAIGLGRFASLVPAAGHRRSAAGCAKIAMAATTRQTWPPMQMLTQSSWGSQHQSQLRGPGRWNDGWARSAAPAIFMRGGLVVGRFLSSFTQKNSAATARQTWPPMRTLMQSLWGSHRRPQPAMWTGG